MPISLKSAAGGSGTISFISGRQSAAVGSGTLINLTAPTGYRVMLTYLAAQNDTPTGETGITVTADGVDVAYNQTLNTSTDQSASSGFFVCSGTSGVTFDSGTSKTVIDTIFAACYPAIIGSSIQVKKVTGSSSKPITYAYAYIR